MSLLILPYKQWAYLFYLGKVMLWAAHPKIITFSKPNFPQKKNMYTDDKKIRDFMHSAVRCYFIPKLPSLFSHFSVHIRRPTKPKKFRVSLARSPSLLFQWIKLSFF